MLAEVYSLPLLTNEGVGGWLAAINFSPVSDIDVLHIPSYRVFQNRNRNIFDRMPGRCDVPIIPLPS